MKIEFYDSYNYYKKLFDNLLLSYYITINQEHKFVYDDFLKHLILDCENIDKKNNHTKNDLSAIFRAQFYNHIKSREWFDKIYNADKCPEVIKKVRKNKLDIIKNAKPE